ncbi:NUDIX hydrolase [Ferrimicrobium acidiphilum]|uniref:NUDIX hydrolase n=1 Tax=Ferrimicrobium acidiphilum TaxID=121039 RepID=UPI00230B6986|nr:NUDIX domain-containing protein [Ferrimicrobium acidiphilum]MDA8398729.1 NUDIX domain-containing protein [Actinomycetota bacterium]
MSRRDFYNDPAAPLANNIVPAASAVVLNADNQILLIRRTDNGRWSIPGGTMEPGEDIASCCIREVEEETGFIIQLSRLIGIYSDPNHVVAYDDGEVRQSFSICFAGSIVSGTPRTSSESSEVAFVPSGQLKSYDIHPSIRQRIEDCLANKTEPFIR